MRLYSRYLVARSFSILCVVFFFIGMDGLFAQSDARPDMVIIMADDLATNELSCYGGKNIVTPHIDNLAKEGLLFNQVFASEAMCVPIRASLFTGLYPVRHGASQNFKPIYKDVKDIGHYLGELGYRVGLAGKKHSVRDRKEFPFKDVEGFELKGISLTADYKLDGIKEFIDSGVRPYCLFVMSTLPHIPWTVGDPSEFDPDRLLLTPNLIDTRETRKQYCRYLAEIRTLDNQVGDILSMLRENGREKNTIIIFLGEQGPQIPGGKYTCWDYGQKSSMIVRFMGKVSPGGESDALIQYEDIAPTLVELAGGQQVPNLDGQSFLSVILSQHQEHRSYVYGIHNNSAEGPPYPSRSIRDKQFKLIHNLTPEKSYFSSAMMEVTPKKPKKQVYDIWLEWLAKAKTDDEAYFLVNRVVHRPEFEFYDLEKDPWELNNLAQNPDYRTEISNYRRLLNKWMEQQGDSGAAIDRLY